MGYHPGAINALTNRKERPHGSGGDQAHWHRPGRGGAAVRRDPLSLERAGRGDGAFLLHGGLCVPGPEHARPRRREGGAAPLPDQAVRPLADDLVAAGGVPPGRRRRHGVPLARAADPGCGRQDGGGGWDGPGPGPRREAFEERSVLRPDGVVRRLTGRYQTANRHSTNLIRNLTFFRKVFDLHVKVGVSSQCRKAAAGRPWAARPARRKETVMDFRLTPEEEAFREEVRDFIEKECPAELLGGGVNIFTQAGNFFAWRAKLAQKKWAAPACPSWSSSSITWRLPGCAPLRRSTSAALASRSSAPPSCTTAPRSRSRSSSRACSPASICGARASPSPAPAPPCLPSSPAPSVTATTT